MGSKTEADNIAIGLYNDNLENAIEQVLSIIEAEKRKNSRNEQTILDYLATAK